MTNSLSRLQCVKSFKWRTRALALTRTATNLDVSKRQILCVPLSLRWTCPWSWQTSWKLSYRSPPLENVVLLPLQKPNGWWHSFSQFCFFIVAAAIAIQKNWRRLSQLPSFKFEFLEYTWVTRLRRLQCILNTSCETDPGLPRRTACSVPELRWNEVT